MIPAWQVRKWLVYGIATWRSLQLHRTSTWLYITMYQLTPPTWMHEGKVSVALRDLRIRRSSCSLSLRLPGALCCWGLVPVPGLAVAEPGFCLFPSEARGQKHCQQLTQEQLYINMYNKCTLYTDTINRTVQWCNDILYLAHGWYCIIIMIVYNECTVFQWWPHFFECWWTTIL